MGNGLGGGCWILRRLWSLSGLCLDSQPAIRHAPHAIFTTHGFITHALSPYPFSLSLSLSFPLFHPYIPLNPFSITPKLPQHHFQTLNPSLSYPVPPFFRPLSHPPSIHLSTAAYFLIASWTPSPSLLLKSFASVRMPK
jgi:hypothetical protein